MSYITTSPVAAVADPDIQRIADRIALEARLAVEKVAASSAEPDTYPIAGDETAIERILAARFAALRPEVQAAAAPRARDRIQASVAERVAWYADLASVDLTSGIAIDAQASALPFPEALKLKADHPLVIFHRLPRPVIPLQRGLSKLEFRILSVHCADETDGFLGSEAGDDEIYLAGTTVDETGDVEKVEPFLVRDDFDDGEQQTYSPPRQVAAFDLTEGAVFPKSYFVTLLLVESDNGGMPEILHKLLLWIKDKVSEAVGAAVGGAIGSAFGPLGSAIGAAIGAVLGAIVDVIRDVWEDDAFMPATLQLDVPDYAARWPGDQSDSPDSTITYTGHGGEYRVVFDWRLFGSPIPEDVPVPPPALRGVIYAIDPMRIDPTTGRRTGERLRWYRHAGQSNGSYHWAEGSGNKVGNGWNFRHVFGGGDGVIYGIEPTGLDPTNGRRTGGRLLWYRHDGWRDGSVAWAPGTGQRVGTGWDFKQVFPGGDGVIYAVRENGELLWYRHVGWREGSFNWAPGSGTKVGDGWNFKQLFSGGDGLIYAVEPYGFDPTTGRRTGGHLLWYRHDGWRDGAERWAGSGQRVGSGWDFKHVFPGAEGVIYAIQENDDLLWYRHDGRASGSSNWAAGSGQKVGNGWSFRHVF